MGGLLVFALLGLYLWLAYHLVRRVNPMWAKALAVVVLVLIPTADAVYGRVRLKQMCEAEGGLKIYKVGQGVAGFYEPLGPDETWITRYDFEFVEGNGTNGNYVNRLIKQSNGTIVLERNVERRSGYQLTTKHEGANDFYARTQFIVSTIDGKEILGKVVDYNYAGGWVERVLAGIYSQRGEGGTCGLKPYVRSLQQDLIVGTLRPLKAVSLGSRK